MIEVHHLTRHFIHHAVQPGFCGALRGLITRKRRIFTAVDDVSFEIQKGEFVGFLGPNGAGKSTCIKMLTGILVPSQGEIRVNGQVPFVNRSQYCRQIGVVFGQRTQLWWDLSPRDAFELLGKIFHLSSEKTQEQIRFFTETLQLAPFLHIPVRQLSLGQRMRCELTAALLHEPQVLFLDEPTIGLDINAKAAIRRFLKRINRERQTTILLTTHDLSDVEELCQRVIVIDKGHIIHDSSLEVLKGRFGKQRIALFDLTQKVVLSLPPHARLAKQENHRYYVEFDGDKLRLPDLIQEVSAQASIHDMSIQEVAIEQVIKKLYEDSPL